VRIRELSREVYVADEEIVKVSCLDVEFLKRQALATPRGRVRLCAHKENGDPVHEMVIVLTRSTYIRPHKHVGKTESFHVIDGVADVVVLDDAGNITEVIPLGDYASGRQFYYRLSRPTYHTLLIGSDILVIHETTNGPFQKGDAMLAPWAPHENDRAASERFIRQLSEACRVFVRSGAAGPSGAPR
jgi:cupin fold WbuC family metalloprotein